MKFIVETVYENIDQEWMDWYLKRLANEQIMPGSTVIAEELREAGHAVFASKDPHGPVTAKTTYVIQGQKKMEQTHE